MRSLIEGGYEGEVYPIHPQLRRSLGLPCFASLEEVPTDIDLAVFATSPQAILPEFDGCARKRVKAVVIISGGFKEKGKEGGALQDQIVLEARARGMRIIGPNCPGTYDPKTKAQTLFQSYERLLRPGPGRISLLTQSTAMACALLEWLAEEGLGISRFIGYGNRADLDEADFLEYLENDIETKLIGIHLESFKDGRRFIEAARSTAQRKPIVIMKTGITSRSSGNVATHIGSLAGSYRLQSAIFRQAGLIEAETTEDFADALKILSFYDAAHGPNLGIVTNGAGLSLIIEDAAAINGLKPAKLDPSTWDALKDVLPPHCVTNNPVDLMGSATSDDYRLAMEGLLRDAQIDILMVCIVLQNTFLDDRIIDATSALLKYGKPIIVCATGGPYAKQRIAALQMKGIPVFPSAERAVRAAACLVARSKLGLRSLDEL